MLYDTTSKYQNQNAVEVPQSCWSSCYKISKILDAIEKSLHLKKGVNLDINL